MISNGFSHKPIEGFHTVPFWPAQTERVRETNSFDVHFAFENFSLKTQTKIPRKTTCKCYKSKRQKPFAEYHFHIWHWNYKNVFTIQRISIFLQQTMCIPYVGVYIKLMTEPTQSLKWERESERVRNRAQIACEYIVNIWRECWIFISLECPTLFLCRPEYSLISLWTGHMFRVESNLTACKHTFVAHAWNVFVWKTIAICSHSWCVSVCLWLSLSLSANYAFVGLRVY